jgi:ABC-2 type transport system ATP-binding protein
MEGMQPLLAVEGLKKTFRGNWLLDSKVALRDVSLEVGEGEIVGLLGPNGSGKSTTFKCVSGLVRPSGGRIELFGLPPRRRAARERLGFLPEDATFPDFLTGEELVRLAATLCGVPRSDAAARVASVLDRVGLHEARRRRIRTYSKGMAQRVGIAQAIVADPKLVILDEPMTGLDPIGRREVRDLVVELAREGAGVIFSTHVLQDVELCCDRVVILADGGVLRQGTLTELLAGAEAGPVEVTLRGLDVARVPALKAQLLARAGDQLVLRAADPAAADALVAAARGMGASVVAVNPVARRLEDVVLRELATQETP